MFVDSNPFGTIDAIEHTTRRELILERLRDAMSNGSLPPGTHLAEIELSERLGVSRGTLREALRHLQQEGLVVADARNRLSVRRVAASEVHDIFAVRIALESLACHQICAMPDRTATIGALRRQLERMARPDVPFAERVKDDLDFHQLLCELSGNTALLQSWLQVGGLARLTITAAGPETAAVNMSAERHRPIVDLLERGDAAAARTYLIQHMSDAEHLIREHLVDRR